MLTPSGHLIYKCGGIDKRTIEKFEKVCVNAVALSHISNFTLVAKKTQKIIGVGGACTPLLAKILRAFATVEDLVLIILHRKLPSWAKVPSNTHGFSTSSRPSVSVVSRSILRYGNSRPQNTMSPLLACIVLKVSLTCY